MQVSATVAVYEGASFLLTLENGDIPAGREGGLYDEDTRFLSQHSLLIGDAEPLALSHRVISPSLSVHFLTNPALPGLPRGSLVIRRGYRVGGGLHADLDITNFGDKAAEFEIELTYDADFADIFEVKRQIEAASPAVAAQPAAATSVGKATLRLERKWTDGRQRAVEIRFSRRPQLDGRSARFTVKLEPGASFRLCQDAYTLVHAEEPAHVCTRTALRIESESRAEGAIPRLDSNDRVLVEAFDRAVADLEALRVRELPSEPGEIHLAAGVPWFSALFGRDSLIVACQVAPFLPELALGVLRSAARFQGTKVDRETGEEPGKILHENRAVGGPRRAGVRYPHYASIDATPLFVIAAHAWFRASGDTDGLRALLPNLEAAMRWIDEYGDRDRDGFVEYAARDDAALENRGWKDSDGAVRFRDGRFAEPPIALVEVQGYVCEALRCAAVMWRALEKDAAGFDRRAAELVAAIDRAFWLEDRGFWALALDGGKRCVDALTSNPGHLLWAGAAAPERLARAAPVFFAPELWSGFGVRTLGLREAAFSPISYHEGSVWPFDNSLLAAGLLRGGRAADAARVCTALLDAAEQYPDRRLPELYCGFDRDKTPFPVDYPTANKPQAWSAGAILLCVRTLLGLEIDAPERLVRIKPTWTERIHRIELAGLACGSARIDIAAQRDARPEVRGLPDGYRLEVE
jgi:glycogen debranching enzyme